MAIPQTGTTPCEITPALAEASALPYVAGAVIAAVIGLATPAIVGRH